MRKDKYIAKDLISNGYDASSSGDSLSTIYGDLVTEHFNKETKGTARPFRSGYSTDMYAVNKWIKKTSHIHSKMRTMLRRKLKVFTLQVHKEVTPGNKRLHFEHVRSLEAKLKQYNVSIFGDGSARNLTTGWEIDKGVIDGLLHAEEVANERFIAFVQDWLVVAKNNSLDLLAK